MKKVLLALALATGSFTATGQDMSGGASNFYKSDRLTMEKVTFDNQYRMKIVGNLFLPKDRKPGVRYPAIIVGHPMGAVKEQSSNLYAQKLAEQGFVTLAIDQSFWGESEGQPRNAVAPDIYAEAFSAAVDYLGTQAFVDRERIGVLGICGSGSFVISAAKIDPRMKAIATVSMYDMGAANRDGLNHSQTIEQRKAIIAAAARQRWVEAAGGETKYTGGTVHQLDADTPPDPARVLRLLPHSAGRVHAEGLVARADNAPDADQQREVHEFLPVQRHRDDLAATDAVHHRRPGALEGVQRGGLQAGGPAQGTLLGEERGPRGPLRPHATSFPSTS